MHLAPSTITTATHQTLTHYDLKKCLANETKFFNIIPLLTCLLICIPAGLWM